MAEQVAKLMWTLITGAFIFGAWSATLEVRAQQHGAVIEQQQKTIENITSKYEFNQERLIDVLGRMDERLKNLEKGK